MCESSKTILVLMHLEILKFITSDALLALQLVSIQAWKENYKIESLLHCNISAVDVNSH